MPEKRFLAVLGHPKATCEMTPDTGGMSSFSHWKWPPFVSSHTRQQWDAKLKFRKFLVFLQNQSCHQQGPWLHLETKTPPVSWPPDPEEMSSFSYGKRPPFVSTRTDWERVAAFKIWKLWWISPKPKLPSARSLAGLGAPNTTSELTLRHWGNEGFFPWKKALVHAQLHWETVGYHLLNDTGVLPNHSC